MMFTVNVEIYEVNTCNSCQSSLVWHLLS